MTTPEPTRHATGDRVPRSGVYETVTGRKIKYDKGQIFQACPDSGEPTDWKSCDV
ncbi:hypothetical protein [Cohnella caldifontis]|uniref:hypothetical protein n=1 Tax=Cohnella caldifontis TaxID=3027471 RepID=UPI0023EB29FA|nr:hypothetical protein [Cohnella sp. YIM B05605]